MRDTGRTRKEEPMTKRRSHSVLSSCKLLWNSSGKSSPKNTMSGFRTGGNTGGSGSGYMSSSSSLSNEGLCVEGQEDVGASTKGNLNWPISSGVEHFQQKATSPVNTLSLIASASTLWWHRMQVAVAKDPWHMVTFLIPAIVSRVSIFWE